MKRVVGLAAALWAAAACGAHAAAVRMDEVQIEGRVQKPEAVFISERPDRVPAHDGVKELRESFLHNTVREARSLAREKARD